MSEFSDQPGFDSGTDFTDPVQDSPQTPEAPPSVSPTPEPKPGNVDKADSPTEQPPVENNPENSEHDVNDLVLSLKESEEEFHAASLENQVYLAEQSKNLLSATILLLFLLGVLSGILFARVVWRKI